jgi:hypothetical protein
LAERRFTQVAARPLGGGLKMVDEFNLNLASCDFNLAIRVNNGAAASSIKRRTSTFV